MSLNNNEKETVFDILYNFGFYDMKHTKGLNSAKTKDALHNLPKTITNSLILPLPEVEKIEDSLTSDNDLDGQGIEKFIKPCNIIDIYTRLEVLLGLKFSEHTNILT